MWDFRRDFSPKELPIWLRSGAYAVKCVATNIRSPEKALIGSLDRRQCLIKILCDKTAPVRSKRCCFAKVLCIDDARDDWLSKAYNHSNNTLSAAKKEGVVRQLMAHATTIAALSIKRWCCTREATLYYRVLRSKRPLSRSARQNFVTGSVTRGSSQSPDGRRRLGHDALDEIPFTEKADA